jgi:hypothetical protein
MAFLVLRKVAGMSSDGEKEKNLGFVRRLRVYAKREREHFWPVFMNGYSCRGSKKVGVWLGKKIRRAQRCRFQLPKLFLNE